MVSQASGMIASLVAPKKDWTATRRQTRRAVHGVSINPARPSALPSCRRSLPAKTARQQFIQTSRSARAKDSSAPVESSVRGFVRSFQNHITTSANGALPTQ